MSVSVTNGDDGAVDFHTKDKNTMEKNNVNVHLKECLFLLLP